MSDKDKKFLNCDCDYCKLIVYELYQNAVRTKMIVLQPQSKLQLLFAWLAVHMQIML